MCLCVCLSVSVAKMLNEAEAKHWRRVQNLEVETEAKFKEPEQNDVLIEYLTWWFNRCNSEPWGRDRGQI